MFGKVFISKISVVEIICLFLVTELAGEEHKGTDMQTTGRTET
jgi:hypothetical protein